MTSTATATAEQLYADLEKAWNSADGAAYGVPFVEDAAYVDVRGVLHRGRDAIAGGHQGIFDTIYAESTVSYSVEDAVEISTGCIVAHALGQLDAPHAPPMPTSARSTAVLVRTDEDWRFAAFQNTHVTA